MFSFKIIAIITLHPCTSTQIEVSQFSHPTQDFIKYGAIPTCSALILSSTPVPSAVKCALNCGKSQECRSFYFKEKKCTTTSQVCKSALNGAVESILRKSISPPKQWAYNNKLLFLTRTAGDWGKAGLSCAKYNGYLWFPSSPAELKHVTYQILYNLDPKYFFRYSDLSWGYKIWTNLRNPRGELLVISENNLPAPVSIIFGNGEPSSETETCVIFSSSNLGFRLDDVHCNIIYHGLCEIKTV